MDVIPQTSLFLGIIPALILLYVGLKGYEGYYKEKTIFLTFVIGIIIGFIAAMARSFTLPLLIIFIILFAFFEQLFKTIILNLGRFHEKKETVIYGLSLGLGFGSVFTPFLIISVSSLITNDFNSLLLIVIGSLGIILFHGSTGLFIGYGIYSRELTKYLFTAIIIQIPFNFIIDLMIISSDDTSLLLKIVIVIGLVIYGLIIFWYTNKKILPKILIENQRRIRSKKIINR
jgi:hypothetical protein